MFYAFTVTFKDGQELNVIDVNQFEDPQISEINTIASKSTQSYMKAQKYGEDIKTIEQKHKDAALIQKEEIVQSKSAKELYDKKIVKISIHSISRTFNRVGSIGRLTYIGLIEKIKKTDTVIKAQWKGYPHLSYTFTKDGDPEKFTFSLAFLLRETKKHKIRMVTVAKSNNEGGAERMESRLIEDPNLKNTFAKMEELFKES